MAQHPIRVFFDCSVGFPLRHDAVDDTTKRIFNESYDLTLFPFLSYAVS